MTLPGRFWAKVEKTDGCWNWTGWVTVKGYGKFHLDGRLQRVHRLAYAELVGPIADGLTIDHLCLNTRCVRPDHLEVVTAAENRRRQGSPWGDTHCRRGHEFPAPDPVTGKRHCVTCARLREQRRRIRYRLAT